MRTGAAAGGQAFLSDWRALGSLRALGLSSGDVCLRDPACSRALRSRRSLPSGPSPHYLISPEP